MQVIKNLIILQTSTSDNTIELFITGQARNDLVFVAVVEDNVDELSAEQVKYGLNFNNEVVAYQRSMVLNESA